MTAFVAPPLPPVQVEWPDLQVWWQLVLQSLGEVLDSQQSQIDTINAIIDPNTLTPDKKPVWMFIYSYLTTEQADIDAKATTYGITTEKTAYDNAVTALTNYLNTLTTDVDWDDTSGNTTIVDTTFRSKFTDVLTKKQTLLNKMQASAKTLADAAQTQANTATSDAATAQTTATTANTNASAASTAASAAQTTANTVKRDDAISTSWTSPGNILTASDAGSDATISIAAHTRKYTDVSSVSVNSGSITGLAYSTDYFIYYDQTSRAGGAVTYHATTDPNVALPGFAAGRHYCGEVTTPAMGGGSTQGGPNPPGGGGGVLHGQIP